MLTFILVCFNGAVCFELCIALFLVQGAELSLKVRYTMISICLALVLALYSEKGQDIENEFEEMNDALYRISWHNMTVRLRKSLAIMLTRHTRPPKLTGSYGILIINRKNFSLIMKASYSYLIVLNQAK